MIRTTFAHFELFSEDGVLNFEYKCPPNISDVYKAIEETEFSLEERDLYKTVFEIAIYNLQRLKDELGSVKGWAETAYREEEAEVV